MSYLTNSFCQSKYVGYVCCKFKFPLPETFTLISFTCKFHRVTFTARFHCLQIPIIRLYRQSPLHANSEIADLLRKSITCRFNYLQIHATRSLDTWLARPLRKITTVSSPPCHRRCSKSTNRLEEARWSLTSHLAENNR